MNFNNIHPTPPFNVIVNSIQSDEILCDWEAWEWSGSVKNLVPLAWNPEGCLPSSLLFHQEYFQLQNKINYVEDFRKSILIPFWNIQFYINTMFIYHVSTICIEVSKHIERKNFLTGLKSSVEWNKVKWSPS